MNNVRKLLIGSTSAIATLLCVETVLLPLLAQTAPPPNAPRFNQLRPWSKSYDCGSSLITLSQQGNSDRYTYQATNARGQSITVRNGTGSGRASSAVYSFSTADGNQFVVEDFRNGRAALTTSSPGVDPATFDCKVATNSTNPPGSNPTPARWSHTYQCGEFRVTLKDEGRNTYSYQTQGLYLKNGERQNTGRSWLYSFYNSDYAYKLEDVWGRAANLKVTHYGGTILARTCRK